MALETLQVKNKGQRRNQELTRWTSVSVLSDLLSKKYQNLSRPFHKHSLNGRFVLNTEQGNSFPVQGTPCFPG
ncbi:hypothetical protein Y1Q_0014815 [Alligator mississippiensis]|nr:hypothetical protein Y1Q_0014815 [Alligator mississippiensis]